MPNQDKKAPIKEVSRPFMDSFEPGKALPKKPFGGNLVRPEDRIARVSADAPKEETSSMSSGNINTPDKSGNYSIRDVPPQDR